MDTCSVLFLVVCLVSISFYNASPKWFRTIGDLRNVLFYEGIRHITMTIWWYFHSASVPFQSTKLLWPSGDICIPVASSSSCYKCTLQWRHNGRDGVSNNQLRQCLLNRLFRRRSKKTSKLRVTGLCAGNSPVTGEFPAQRASNAENFSIWWLHREWNIRNMKKHKSQWKLKISYEVAVHNLRFKVCLLLISPYLML